VSEAAMPAPTDLIKTHPLMAADMPRHDLTKPRVGAGGRAGAYRCARRWKDWERVEVWRPPGLAQQVQRQAPTSAHAPRPRRAELKAALHTTASVPATGLR
jgi:hypothetical protein